MKLHADHLLKKYKSRTVVNDVSIEVSQGEIVGLLPSEDCRRHLCTCQEGHQEAQEVSPFPPADSRRCLKK